MHVEDHNKLYRASSCKYGMQNKMVVKIEWNNMICVTFNPAQPTMPVTTVVASGWRAAWKKNH